MLAVLVLTFIAVATIELYLFILIGNEIGALNTILAIIFSCIVGAWLAKMQGLQLVWSVQRQLQRGKAPAKQMMDGLAVFIGALLLITPGFFTGAIGLLMVLPIGRRLFGTLLKLLIMRGISQGKFKTNFHFFSHRASTDFYRPDSFRDHSGNQQDAIEADYEKHPESDSGNV